MKKTTIALLACLTAVMLSGCSGKTSSSSDVTSSTSADTSAEITDTSVSGSEASESTTTAAPLEESAPSEENISSVPDTDSNSDVTAEAPVLPEPADCPIKAEYSADRPDITEFESFHIDADDTQTLVMFTTEKTVSDFTVLSLAFESIDDDGNITYDIAQSYSFDEFRQDTPIEVGMIFAGSIPTNGISYTDENGSTRRFSINISGYDGSLFLQEF